MMRPYSYDRFSPVSAAYSVVEQRPDSGDEAKTVRYVGIAYTERDARLFALSPLMLDELRKLHHKLVSDLDDMTCDAGNPDGGSVDSCEHCATRSWLTRVTNLLEGTWSF